MILFELVRSSYKQDKTAYKLKISGVILNRKGITLC